MLRTVAKRAAITGGLEVAGLVHACGILRQARGRGTIFTLHHVRPKRARSFDPNAHLEITPEFLEAAVIRLRRGGYRFLALDELPAYLASADAQPVAVFTLDDGYRNNLDYAAPVFTRHGVPFTVFVAGGFVDRTHTLWWETLADLLQARSGLTFDFGNGNETLPLGKLPEKQAAFDRFATFVHRTEEAEAVGRLNNAARAHNIDALQIAADLTLDDAGLRKLIENPLASLGAHTVSHRAMSRLTHEAACGELQQSSKRIERITGRRPLSLAYPYGDIPAVSPREHRLAKDLGFTTAVTTQPGILTGNIDMTALPRISLNGHFQKTRYVSALASGIPFKLTGRG